MNYDTSANKIQLTGEILSDARFSHELYGERFFGFSLLVVRLSGTPDILPVTVSERLLRGFPFMKGESVCITGQIRSYNKLICGKSKLILTVFAQELFPTEGKSRSSNTVTLTGYLCKPPVYRKTPFCREICDVLLAVNRSYGKSDYIPAICWGRNARFVKFLPIGERLTASGRFQSRVYLKRQEDETAEKRTAYEVSIAKIETGEAFREREESLLGEIEA